ncbi:hypothetical protein VF14_03265 [Nostoc linckia z18]|uniref:Uncharacterized protein n=3 Tax=Nostoc linckia TaxID=92942 RepID=A0A9Q5ZH66_NOSLI|nr:hypothetical protein VF02_00735 [Nostoc linckia z1]PHJ73455.1 hypothetical protein VF05_01750 [Nostoc linckia z3]PHJ78791.1 hypothetical protein VF03_00735 [Nostoc linckia z2]PHJ85874.1 hypothetical protein VF06_06055 [Nostoc linckia z4]PHJ92409.1 hypothetical protein VF07_02040 [Nostoc linckia z6]PHK01387.1 hypothetical protein VF04_00735 [Nostoc linckia z7]PHK07336.1 hypothetical protein VF08_01215 [Nostoc linckia z8]PHK13091.1 hypothetical protein VF09_01300 [Nostoc linckia z9]PHK2375
MPSSNNEEVATPRQPQKSSGNGGFIEIIAEWIINAISIPFTFLSTILELFLTPGSSGTKIIGAIGFAFGTFLSTDGIWQTLFQGTPMFPWWEENWIGWIGWLTIPFNILFWIGFAMSALVQIMEARTLRGKDPKSAKVEFEESQQYNLPGRPTGKIDLSQALWRDYKRAGMKERRTGAGIALFFWIFDFITTFAGRNPFRYTEPSQIIGCFAYNILSMMAGETGFAIWRYTKK